MKLNMGCANNKLEGYLNVDISKDVNPDKIVNLDESFPFEDNTFDEIVAYHILEHMKDQVFTLQEMWRVSKPGAIIKIRAPHASHKWAWMDLTHKHPFTYQSLDYCSIDEKGNTTPLFFHEYGKMKFRILKRRLNFYGLHNKFGLDRIANQIPFFWESYLSGIAQPCEVLFKLKVIKTNKDFLIGETILSN